LISSSQAAIKTFKVPVIFALLEFNGSFMLLGTLGIAA